MNRNETPREEKPFTRREFVKTTAGLTAAAAFPLIPSTAWAGASAHVAGSDTIRVGLIGCGGRGTGAAMQSLQAAPETQVVALADVFSERVQSSRGHIARHERGKIDDEHCYLGFDAYQQLLEHADVDLVILATPPHFRPMHLEAAIKAGKHVFMEKPVAVDAPGIRKVIAAGQEAQRKKLSIVAGTQRRHETCYLEAMKRLQDGAIGEVISARCYWNQGGLWMNERQDSWSDMEWQLRNWLYFTWLSGDHIVEQHVHNLDAVNWAMGGHPVKAMGMGGRQVRTSPKYGHIFDHFAVEYEYASGGFLESMCRQIDNCTSRVEEVVYGTTGRMRTHSGYAEIFGPRAWRFEGDNGEPYVQEHVDLIASVREGKGLNEAQRIAESTLTAIMGRMSAYTGQEITWEQALNSQESLGPDVYEFGSLPVPPVAVPGRTPFV
ncbi:MAG: Gfo/Idh/MocA family oxidoreductase [Phycisphaerales bacterium]|nr:Gfo/Idh/MocA family oxidoreductase [Phycisphaerales bacterium]